SHSSTHCCDRVLGHNAARMFAHPAPLLRKPVVRKLIEESSGTIIEYGAGCLRNALYLQERGWTVAVVELPRVRARFPLQYQRFKQAGGYLLEWNPGEGRAARCPSWPPGPPRKYDLALMTFVLETLCRPCWRTALLSDCSSRLKPTGTLLLSLRGVSDVVTRYARGVRCSDGYLTPLRTFVRSYTCRQANQLLRSAGFTEIIFLHKKRTLSPELLHLMAKR